MLYTGATERSQSVHDMLTTWLWSRRALRTSRAYILIELAESSRLTPSIQEENRGGLGGVRYGTARSVVGQGGSGGFCRVGSGTIVRTPPPWLRLPQGFPFSRSNSRAIPPPVHTVRYVSRSPMGGWDMKLCPGCTVLRHGLTQRHVPCNPAIHMRVDKLAFQNPICHSAPWTEGPGRPPKRTTIRNQTYVSHS